MSLAQLDLMLLKAPQATTLKGKRDRAVVMTKVCTHGRDKNVAMRQLEESLIRLQTDHLDVWQIHEVIYENEGVLFDRLRWGRIREHISYEDTQRTVEFDRRLGVA